MPKQRKIDPIYADREPKIDMTGAGLPDAGRRIQFEFEADPGSATQTRIVTGSVDGFLDDSPYRDGINTMLIDVDPGPDGWGGGIMFFRLNVEWIYVD